MIPRRPPCVHDTSLCVCLSLCVYPTEAPTRRNLTCVCRCKVCAAHARLSLAHVSVVLGQVVFYARCVSRACLDTTACWLVPTQCIGARARCYRIPLHTRALPREAGIAQAVGVLTSVCVCVFAIDDEIIDRDIDMMTPVAVSCPPSYVRRPHHAFQEFLITRSPPPLVRRRPPAPCEPHSPLGLRGCCPLCGACVAGCFLGCGVCCAGVCLVWYSTLTRALFLDVCGVWGSTAASKSLHRPQETSRRHSMTGFPVLSYRICVFTLARACVS